MMSFPKLVKCSMLVLSVSVLASCGGGSGGGSGGVLGGGDSVTHSSNTDSSSSNNTTPSSPSNSGGSSNSDIFTGNSSVSLSWTAPTTYTNGSNLSALSGHKVYINSGSGYSIVSTLTNPSISNFLVENLIAGTYTFAVTAFDANGIESTFSESVTVVVNS